VTVTTDGFRRLRVGAVEPLTEDSVTITFEIPNEHAAAFRFRAGQHLTLRRGELRRTYSLCSAEDSGVVQIAVKRHPGGAVSTWLTERLRPGDHLDVMPPMGGFGPAGPGGPARTGRVYALIAAGSGITPMMSIAATVLAAGSEVILVYGNRVSSNIMFVDALADLKDRYPDRLQILHILSREEQAAGVLNGRISRERLAQVFAAFLPPGDIGDWYVCGPHEMVSEAREAILSAGADPARIHCELFHVGTRPGPHPPAPSPAAGATVSVLLNGRTTTLHMARQGQTVLDALLAVRPDAPYACKSGVCGTCRARCVEGEVDMAANYAVETDEIRSGTVLTCQSRPVSPVVRLEFR
jgi:ring-1,2-phenylacetyl-CoA epoxidase subunit PaaE